MKLRLEESSKKIKEESERQPADVVVNQELVRYFKREVEEKDGKEFWPCLFCDKVL